MKSLLVILLAVCATFTSSLPAYAGERATPRVGVVLDGESSQLNTLLERVMSETRTIAKAGRDIEFPADKRRVASHDSHSVKQHVAALVADPDVDIVLGFGVLASAELARQSSLPKPAIAPFLVDMDQSKNTPTPQNLSSVFWPIDVERDFVVLEQLGASGKLAWLGAAHMQSVLAPTLARAKQISKEHGMDLVEVPVGSSAAAALESIPPDAQTVYLAPNPQLSDEERLKLVEGLLERKLISFSWLGIEEVRRGVLAGLGSTADTERLVRRIALNLRAVSAGSTPNQLMSHFKRDEQLTLNMATARYIGLEPDWSLVLAARQLNAERGHAGRTLTLQTAVSQALRQNLDLQALEYEVQAGDATITRARANLLPQLEGAIAGVWIDEDRTGLGRSERTLQWSATLSQPIYSEQAWANFSIQKHLQKARLEQRRLTQLDVASAVALGYLTVLKAKTLERIQRRTLDSTREHLAAARVRVAVGAANRAEVARWESQLADARRALVWAVAQRNAAEMEINRILDRPLEEAFLTAEATVGDAQLLGSNPRFQALLANKGKFELLRNLLVREAIVKAPELAQFEEVIAAKSRQATAEQRGHYVPTVGFFAGATHRFVRDGAGSEQATLPTLPGGQALPVPSPDALDWQFGVQASIPLFESGARVASVNQLNAEAAQLRIQRRATELRVEQRVRTALHRAGAALPAIDMAQTSKRAAQQTLEITEDAYAQGTATLVQMLDAQNQAIVSELAAANATYDYLVEIVNVERAIGRVHLPSNRDDTSDLVRRMEALH